MKKCLMIMLSILTAAVFADEWVWIGGHDAEWTSANAPSANNANNWTNSLTGAKGYPNSASDIAVFDGDATLACAWNAGDQKFGGMKILRGTVRVLSLYDINRPVQFAAPTNVIEIADGAVLNLEKGPSIYGADADEQVVVLTGGGNLIWSGNTTIGAKSDGNYALKDFIVRDFHGGVFDIDGTTCKDDSIYVLHLASGMTLRWVYGAENKMPNNKVANDCVIRLDSGAVADMNGCADTLGAFVGEGSVVNPGSIAVSLPNDKGPFDFGGSFAGTMNVQSGATALGGNSYILLTSSNAFAETTFGTVPFAGGAFLRFAPGIGTFAVKGFVPSEGQRLVLEDTDGEPVSVVSALGTTGSETVLGAGDFIYNGAGESTYTGTALNHTGNIGAASGIAVLGNGNAANDPPFAQYAGFFANDPGKLRFKNGAAVKIDAEISGDGTIEANGPAEWTAYRQSGGTLNDFSSLSLVNPDATPQAISVWENASIAISSGRITGPTGGFATLNGSAGTSLVITNGASVKASSLNVRNISVKDSTLTINGGLSNTGSVEEPQIIRFDGATVRLGDGSSSSADSWIGTLDLSAVHRRVYVKEGGVTVVSTPAHFDYGYSIKQFDSETASGVADGGVTLSGSGWLRLDGLMNITGPLRFFGGQTKLNVTPFGTTGDVEFGTSRLADNTAVAVHFASGAGSKAVLSGAMTIALNAGSTYTFGASGAAEDSVFTRSLGGVLFFESASAVSQVSVNGGIADTAAGVSRMPIFTYTVNRGDAGASTGRNHLQFASLAGGGISEVYGAAWDGSGDTTGIALVDSASEIVVSANRSVGGIRLFGRNGAAISIASGAKLNVGDGSAPAAILMNNNHASGRGKARIDGPGAIDFGASEGVIAINLIQSGSIESEVNCPIAGTAGVTFAAPGESAWLSLSAASTYSGGTYIGNMCIDAKNGACFGVGPVTVAPGPYYSGEVRFERTATYANNFTVGGWGSQFVQKQYNEGAFWFTAPQVTLNGTVELVSDTRIGGAVNASGIFNGVISGTGPLAVRGESVMVFKAANTFTGGLSIAAGSTVEVGAGATLGADAVVVDGTLRFVNTSDIVVQNAISGSGMIELAGTGKVSFRDRKAFTGTIISGGAAFDVGGTDMTVGYLEGAGDLENSGEAATVTVEGTHLASFAGAISGDISLVKAGDSVQALTGASSYSGATTIEGGTLRLGELPTSATLPVADNVVRLDAGAGIEKVAADDNRVASWADADGKSFTFANVLPKAGETLGYAEIVERDCGPALSFNPQSWIRLDSGAALSERTIFCVYNLSSAARLGAGFAEVFGSAGVDDGLRQYNNSFNDAQTDWVNGVSGRQITPDTVQLFTREWGTAMSRAAATVGGYSIWKRPWGGDIHEIVVYDRTLTGTEREAVNDYLMVKWGIRDAKAAEKLTNVLPQTTDVTVGIDGTLDLAGNDQTLASFVCYGSVTNSASRKAVLTLDGDSQVAPGASFGAPRLDVVLANGATLDLGGGTFTIRRLIKNGGTVVNGTLVELKPLGGFYISIR